jgi:hypothetical protein
VALRLPEVNIDIVLPLVSDPALSWPRGLVIFVANVIVPTLPFVVTVTIAVTGTPVISQYANYCPKSSDK